MRHGGSPSTAPTHRPRSWMHAAGSRGTPPARRDETTRRPAPTCLRHADEVMRDTSPTLPHYFSFNPPISEEPTHAVPDRHRSKARAKPARRARGLISVRLPRPACALLARCVKLEQHRRPARSRARMHATSRPGRVGPPHHRYARVTSPDAGGHATMPGVRNASAAPCASTLAITAPAMPTLQPINGAGSRGALRARGDRNVEALRTDLPATLRTGGALETRPIISPLPFSPSTPPNHPSGL
jgi:hypothetical protein